MEYTKEYKQKKFNSLPDDLKEAILSVDTNDKLIEIYKKHSLMLDQASELGNETGLLMFGLTKENDYVNNLSKKLNISTDKAILIAKDVNTEILDSIRDSLRKIQAEEEVNELNNTDKEVDQETKSAEPILNVASTISSIEKAGDFTVDAQHVSSSPQYNDTNLNREAVLKGIEDVPVALVDHLLTTPINNSQQVEVKKEENKTYTVDPYREQM